MNRPSPTTEPGQMKYLRARGPVMVGYLALAALVAGFGGWSVTTTIAGAIIAPGRIEVEQDRQVVQHPEGGVVGQILVGEGDVVKAGDTLIRLDDTAKKSELAVINSQYFELLARRGRLEAERDNRARIIFNLRLVAAARNNPAIRDLLDGQRRLFIARRASLQKQIQQMGERDTQIAARIGGLTAQRNAQAKQLALIRADLARRQKLLKKGLIQAAKVSTLKREMARLEGAMGQVAASVAEAAGRRIETRMAVLRLFTSRREEAITKLRDIQYRELELSQKRFLLKQTLSRLTVRAPVSGAIYGMQVHAVRSVVRPAEALMYIVPLGRPLVITSRISPTRIDQVHVGQPVTMRFPAFDRRTTPELFGKVVSLSADAFTDGKTGRSYYRAEIVPDTTELGKLGKLKLLPGMPVESFIATTDRTPLNYLLKPVTDYFGKALRDD